VAIVLPVEPLDPSSAAAAGLEADFLGRMDAGAAVIEQLLPGVRTIRAAWPVDDRLTAEGAALLQTGGVDLFVVPLERYATWDGSLPTLTDTSLLVSGAIDDDATAHLRVVDPVNDVLDADAGGTPLQRAVELMAVAATTRYEFGPDLRSFALTTAELGVPDPEVLAALVPFVEGHPEISFTTPDLVEQATNSFFINGVEFTVRLDSRPSTSLDARAEAARASRFMIADVESMLPADDPRPAQWNATVRVALSTAVTDAAADERIEEVDREVADVRAAVRRPEPFAFTLAGNESAIPLRIENTGPTPLRIRVHAEAEQLTFPEGDVTAVLEPNATTDISIPVAARSNGVFPVQVEVFTPAGNALFEPIALTARFNSLTGLGRVATVGAALVLASWWFSYFRRRRKQRRDAALDAAQGRHPAGNGTPGDTPGDTDEHELASDLSPDAAEAAIVRDVAGPDGAGPDGARSPTD